jgi:hypothetical protein
VSDTAWGQEIKDIKQQTAATWLEIPVLFDQAAPGSTTVVDGPSTPSVDAFAYGVREAVAEGFHVFFIPLSGVETPGGWAGIIQLSSQSDEQAWFNSYWSILKPYAVAAQASGASQMAIGTELSWLQDNAPASMWNQLIDRVHSVFTGTLTYDVNWYPTLYDQPASWLKNPELGMIGVSEYIPLTDVDERLDPASMPALWKQKVESLLDTFAGRLGKQIMLTEIGYRDNSDAGYNPSYADSTGSVDQQEQAGAYTAALEDAFADTHIAGIFFWAWSDAGALSFAGTQAVNVVYRWYAMQAPAS